MYIMPIPQPKQKANDMNKCQISVAAEEENSPANTSAVPISIVEREPISLRQAAETGEMRRACETDRPPIMAYSNLVASGKMLPVL